MSTSSVFAAPQGKFRVVSFSLYEVGGCLIRDCDSLKQATEICDTHNATENFDRYYVYSDRGKCLYGHNLTLWERLKNAMRHLWPF